MSRYHFKRLRDFAHAARAHNHATLQNNIWDISYSLVAREKRAFIHSTHQAHVHALLTLRLESHFSPLNCGWQYSSERLKAEGTLYLLIFGYDKITPNLLLEKIKLWSEEISTISSMAVRSHIFVFPRQASLEFPLWSLHNLV